MAGQFPATSRKAGCEGAVARDWELSEKSSRTIGGHSICIKASQGSIKSPMTT